MNIGFKVNIKLERNKKQNISQMYSYIYDVNPEEKVKKKTLRCMRRLILVDKITITLI
jgi:hypothetical protein